MGDLPLIVWVIAVLRIIEVVLMLLLIHLVLESRNQ